MVKKVKKKKKKTGLSKNQLITACSILGVIIVCILCLIFIPRDEKWIQNGNVITKGEVSYKIGDYYEYDETNGGKIEGLNDVKWKVLGVEKGNLLIMSSSNVDTLTLGKEDNLEVSMENYKDGIKKLDEIAKLYGNGEGAISSRSIRSEDINKITGYEYDKKDYFATYYWSNEENPTYKTSDLEEGSLTLNHNNIFVFYDVKTKKWNTSTKPSESLNETKITKLTDTFYSYNNDLNYDGNLLLAEGSLEYNMLYLNDDLSNANYWTANQFIYLRNSFVGYGYQIMKYNELNYTYIVYSSGNTRETTAGVRAVVTID